MPEKPSQVNPVCVIALVDLYPLVLEECRLCFRREMLVEDRQASFPIHDPLPGKRLMRVTEHPPDHARRPRESCERGHLPVRRHRPLGDVTDDQLYPLREGRADACSRHDGFLLSQKGEEGRWGCGWRRCRPPRKREEWSAGEACDTPEGEHHEEEHADRDADRLCQWTHVVQSTISDSRVQHGGLLSHSSDSCRSVFLDASVGRSKRKGFASAARSPVMRSATIFPV